MAKTSAALKPIVRSVAKKRRRFASQSETTRRQHLLVIAKKLFARQGLKETSIRDIASAAELNSSLISYYFEGKEGLYRECLREITEQQLHFVDQLLQPAKDLSECRLRLRLMAENMIRTFFDDRETGLIVMREYDRIHSPAEMLFKSSFLKMFDRLIEFFKQSQDDGFLKDHQDPFILASLFFGAIFGEMRVDHLKQKLYKRSIRSTTERSKMLDQLIDLFFP